MSEAIVTLKKGEGRMLKSGGLWIFDNEIASILGSFEDGDIVAVHDFDGYGLFRRSQTLQPRKSCSVFGFISPAFCRYRAGNSGPSGQ